MNCVGPLYFWVVLDQVQKKKKLQCVWVHGKEGICHPVQQSSLAAASRIYSLLVWISTLNLFARGEIRLIFDRGLWYRGIR